MSKATNKHTHEVSERALRMVLNHQRDRDLG